MDTRSATRAARDVDHARRLGLLLRLHEIRKAKGLSVADLSAITGIHDRTIYAPPGGHTGPSYKVLDVLARALGHRLVVGLVAPKQGGDSDLGDDLAAIDEEAA